jgi:hypothetical protein
LRWGYFLAVFSVFALIVGFFLYGRNLSLPVEPGIALFYRAGFFFANPLVAYFEIESLFVHLMLAGVFQVVVSFGLGCLAGFVYHLVRR